VLCLDEFPYLAAVDASLPSRLQKWLDHSLPGGGLLIVAGSSSRVMNGLFAAPEPVAHLRGRGKAETHSRPRRNSV
jgi:hypothetical protein